MRIYYGYLRFTFVFFLVAIQISPRMRGRRLSVVWRGAPLAPTFPVLAQESDMLLAWPSIHTAIRPTASGLVGVTTVPSLPLRWAAAARPAIRTRVPAG